MIGDPFFDVLFAVVGMFGIMLATMADAAFRAVSRTRLDDLADQGNVHAQACLRLKDDQDRLRGGVQVVQALLLIAVTVLLLPYVELLLDEVARLLPESAAVGVLHFAIIAVGVMLFGVVGFLVPVLVARGIGAAHPEVLAFRLRGPLSLIITLTRIPAALARGISNVVLRPFKARVQFGDAIVTEEGLLDILEEGTKSGILDATEQELIESIFEFTETTASEIMIPRKDVVAIEAEMSPEEMLEYIIDEGFTRMPVYTGSLDTILGIVYAKDLVSLIQHKNLIILQDIVRPAFFVPETKPISELLREFQRRKIHLAVVVDEFGGTEGIITMEDILEEIVGDIQDEYDEDTRPFTVQPDGSVEVDGGMNITDFNELTDFALPESGQYDTIGGFINTSSGRIPVEGDLIMTPSAEVRVLSVVERRVKLARFTHRTPDTDD